MRGSILTTAALRWKAAALSWAALIWWLSSRPGSATSPALPFAHADKLVHAALFGVFAALLHAALAAIDARPRLRSSIALASAAIWGAIDEFHQTFVPGRSPDVLDWVADAAGAAAVIGFLHVRGGRLPSASGFVR